MTTSDAIAAASLGVSAAALAVSWYAIRRANRTTSAATMVALNEGFRAGWNRFFGASTAEEKESELAELLNLFEIACAACLERSLSGNSAELMNEYLNTILKSLAANDYASSHVGALLQNAETFIFIKRFLRVKRSSLSITVPPQWFETQ